MNNKIKFFLHRYHYLIVGVTIITVIGLGFWLYSSGEDWKILIPIILASVSLIYIIEKQQLDEANLFKDLFSTFNSRYDALNEEMNRIRSASKAEMDVGSVDVLDDYFNLCGEEYLYYQNGYIYPEVWRSWVNGMRTYYLVPEIKLKWDEEIKTGSYYGFEIAKELDRLNKNGRES